MSKTDVLDDILEMLIKEVMNDLDKEEKVRK